MHLDYAADVTRMRISRACLGNPGKVRVAVKVAGEQPDGDIVRDWLGARRELSSWVARGLTVWADPAWAVPGPRTGTAEAFGTFQRGPAQTGGSAWSRHTSPLSDCPMDEHRRSVRCGAPRPLGDGAQSPGVGALGTWPGDDGARVRRIGWRGLSHAQLRNNWSTSRARG